MGFITILATQKMIGLHIFYGYAVVLWVSQKKWLRNSYIDFMSISANASISWISHHKWLRNYILGFIHFVATQSHSGFHS